MTRRDAVAGLILLGILALIPRLTTGGYVLDLGVLTFLFISQAIAWNILGGYAGQVSFGYAAFFGIGGYATGILWLHGWQPLATLPVAALAAAAFSLAIGLPAFRLTGAYFVIATLAVGLAMRVVALNLDTLTGGASGLNLPSQAPEKAWFYYSMLTLLSASFVLSGVVRGSRLGMALASLRLDQAAAASLGINVAFYKNVAHTLGAVIVAVGGGLYAVYFQYIHPDQLFGFEVSIGMVLMPVIGGLGTLWGPVLGGTLYYAIQDTLLTIFPFAHLLVYGLLLMVIMLVEPRGLIGMARLLKRPATAVARQRLSEMSRAAGD
jgi:branched-chain amino acid transport system permease protein